MEHSGRVAVVRCELGWSDIGSWSALSDLLAADESGNRVDGQALLLDVRDCAVHAQGGRLVGALGVEGLVRCPSNFAFQMAALMPPWMADRHAC